MSKGINGLRGTSAESRERDRVVAQPVETSV